MSKEIDIHHVKIEDSSRSKRKEIRDKKRAGKEEEAKEAWRDDKNRPDHIKKRIDDYLYDMLECTLEIYPKEKKVLEEIFTYSDDKVIEELVKYEGVAPEKRKEELNLVEFFRKRFSEKERTTDPTEQVYKTLGIYRWFLLLNRAHKEDLESFFSVDGAGKTILDKIIGVVRKEGAQKKR